MFSGKFTYFSESKDPGLNLEQTNKQVVLIFHDALSHNNTWTGFYLSHSFLWKYVKLFGDNKSVFAHIQGNVSLFNVNKLTSKQVNK